MLKRLKELAKRVIPQQFHPIMFALRRQRARSLRRQRLIGGYATAVLTETAHGKLLVSAADIEIGEHLAKRGNYGLDSVELCHRLLPAGARVLVVGTHVGALLMPIAQRAEAVVGIEANPETFRLLQMNVLLNGLTNVELHQIAAGDEDKEVKFLMHSCNTGSSSVLAGNLNGRRMSAMFDEPRTVTVPQRRLDEILDDQAFDLVIMDIEGHEASAIAGMHRVLHGASMMQIELVPHLARERSGAAGGDLAAALASYFPRCWLLEDRIADASPEPTEAYVRRLMESRQTGCDLWLEK